MGLKVFLRDRNEEVVKAWQSFFSRAGKVDVALGDVLETDVQVVVTPINSFGIMDTDLASQLNKKSDGSLESRVRKMILDKHAGELPVGFAEMLPTNLEKPQYIIVAPTFRVPARMTNPTVSTYLATRGAFRALAQFMREEQEDRGQSSIESVALVGMGTGSGKCPAAVAAFQMYEAYCQIVLGQVPNFATIEAASAHDSELRKSRFV